MKKFLITALATFSVLACDKAPYAPPEPVTEPNTPGIICVDQPLTVEFESAPVLGGEGLIRVYTADGTEVDRIDMADRDNMTTLTSGITVPSEQITATTVFHTFMDALHCTRYRIVSFTPVKVKGNNLEIRLHSDALDFDTEYYLTIDEGVVGGFDGIRKGEYSFKTAKAPESAEKLRVAADGSGDFCTIQRAFSYAPKTGCEITVAPGTYEELLYLRDKNGITLRGDSRDGVKIVCPNSELYNNGSGSNVTEKPNLGSPVTEPGGRCVFLAENCSDLRLENLTIENTFWADDHKGQAETIYFNDVSNARKFVIENCSLISWQDTFLTKGQVWVHNSLIAGHVDYIWGYPDVCLFEDCEIRSRAAGYIVQARVPAGHKGFVFLNCSLTAESGVKDGTMYLARSGGNPSVQDNVLYVNCKMSPVIASAGWFGPSVNSGAKTPTPGEPTESAGWREYGSVTPAGAPVTGHNSYGKVLTATEAAPYLTRESILGWKF